jgi:hypothetical protein
MGIFSPSRLLQVRDEPALAESSCSRSWKATAILIAKRWTESNQLQRPTIVRFSPPEHPGRGDIREALLGGWERL